MKKLTKPQYDALKKWENGKPQNETANRVREDVYWRLRNAGYLQHHSFMMRTITDSGRAAIIEFEATK